MKETGIDWMPEVPEHWEIRRLKTLAKKIQTGSTPKTEDSKYHFDDGDINWFTPGDIKDFFVADSNRKVTQRAITDKAVELYPEKSILVVGIGATLGKVSMITEKGGSNQQINAIICNEELMPEFALFFLSSFEDVLKSISNASTLAILTQSDLKKMIIALPKSLDEQERIVEYIKAETRTLDIAISKAEREIELIKEYREAMIAEAVTGKMKL
jgi:restriction endonuclease S subunit